MKDNNLCKLLILNSLEDGLAESYSKKDKAQEVWESLEKQYKDDENMSKIYLVNKFTTMEFEDEKAVLPQVKELMKLQ